MAAKKVSLNMLDHQAWEPKRQEIIDRSRYVTEDCRRYLEALSELKDETRRLRQTIEKAFRVPDSLLGGSRDE